MIFTKLSKFILKNKLPFSARLAKQNYLVKSNRVTIFAIDIDDNTISR